MTRALLLRWAALCLLCLPTGPASAAPKLRVAVDGSGSMRGYFKAGGLDTVLRALAHSAEESGWQLDAKVFHAPDDLAPLKWSPLAQWRGGNARRHRCRAPGV